MSEPMHLLNIAPANDRWRSADFRLSRRPIPATAASIAHGRTHKRLYG